MRTLDMKMHSTSGTLITFCGLDGCGKSTLIARLYEYLVARGYDVILTKQPTPAMRKSRIFRGYMDTSEHASLEYRALSLAAAADRLQHSKELIMPALEEGKVVISDRYFYSCLANLRARGYGSDGWIYEVARHIPSPDLAFFLDVPTEVAVARVRERPEERERYIDMPLQYCLRVEYLDICRSNAGICVSSGADAESAFEIIKYNVDKYLEDKNARHKK